jgi:23S rRNA (guanosine2251-2'-O)-methyltransferase
MAVSQAALATGRVQKIVYKKGEINGSLKVIIAKAREQRIKEQALDVRAIDTLCGSTSHQGVAAYCMDYRYYEIEEIIESSNGQPLFILIMDSITDTHNFGAILRTAEACGVHGVIIPKHRSAGLETAAKASAGAYEHIKIARVTNINQTIEKLKKHDIWITAIDMGGKDVFESDLTGNIALVIGGEDNGISRLTKEKCDFFVTIPMYGKIPSLNASVAASVVIYEALRQRR